MAGEPPWQLTAGGVALVVRLTPKGGRDAIDGIEQLADGRSVLKARVRAAPTEGEANAALISLLAKTLDVPRRTVTLAAGETARINADANVERQLRLAEAARANLARRIGRPIDGALDDTLLDRLPGANVYGPIAPADTTGTLALAAAKG